MTIIGWRKRYSEILNEFGYDEKNDLESAKILNSLIKVKPDNYMIRLKIFSIALLIVSILFKITLRG